MNEQALQELERLLTEKFPAGIPRHKIGEATRFDTGIKNCNKKA